MTVAVVDSGGANIASVMHALRRLGADPIFTADPRALRAADKVILPGVGAAASAMQRLEANGLAKLIPSLQQPVLGICLGMQLLFESTEEGDVDLLGLIPARVTRLPVAAGLRVPHMGWSKITFTTNYHENIFSSDAWFYFVHSFFAPLGLWTMAKSQHGAEFSAMVRQRNFYGVQFHPERSASSGAAFLERFLALEAA